MKNLPEIEIREVTTPGDLKTFVYFPRELYKGNPYWVPPMYQNVFNTFSPQKNAAYEYSRSRQWLALRARTGPKPRISSGSAAMLAASASEAVFRRLEQEPPLGRRPSERVPPGRDDRVPQHGGPLPRQEARRSPRERRQLRVVRHVDRHAPGALEAARGVEGPQEGLLALEAPEGVVQERAEGDPPLAQPPHELVFPPRVVLEEGQGLVRDRHRVAAAALRRLAVRPRATSCKVRQRTVTPPRRLVPGSIPGSPTISRPSRKPRIFRRNLHPPRWTPGGCNAMPNGYRIGAP